MSYNAAYYQQQPRWPQNNIPGVGTVPGGPSGGNRSYERSLEMEYIQTIQTTPNNSTVTRYVSPDRLSLNPRAASHHLSAVTDQNDLRHQETPSATSTYTEASRHNELQSNPNPQNLGDFGRLLAENSSRNQHRGSGARRQQVDDFATRRRSPIRRDCQRSEYQNPYPSRRDPSLPPEFTANSTFSNIAASRNFQTRHKTPVSTLTHIFRPTAMTEPDALNAAIQNRTPRLDERDADEEEHQCQCPISNNCPHKTTTQKDCRQFVPDRMERWERQDQDAFERHRDANPRGERFTNIGILTGIVKYIDDFMSASSNNTRRTAIRRMVEWIFAMEDVTLEDNRQKLAATEHIVPRIRTFLDPKAHEKRRMHQLPGFIEEELTILERKWQKNDFSGSPKRGLTVIQNDNGSGVLTATRYALNKEYPYYVNASYFGAGNLVNGQSWTSRMELCRDGVHAATQAGISGTPRDGAYSIVLGAFDEKKNQGYANIDMGETIEYMGTALSDEKDNFPTNETELRGQLDREPTAGTRALMKSLDTKEPVRVIRSHATCSVVSNKPFKGYRYDGLYTVVGKTLMNRSRQIWRFRLQRLPVSLPTHGELRGFRLRAEQRESTSGIKD